jgi:hypothetical protein
VFLPFPDFGSLYNLTTLPLIFRATDYELKEEKMQSLTREKRNERGVA